MGLLATVRRQFSSRGVLSGRNILLASMLAGLQVISACARPGVTITIRDPDGHSVTIRSTPGQLPPNSTLIGWTPDANGWPIYRAPDGRIFVCRQYWGIQTCAAVEVQTTNPNGTGGWPYNNLRGMAQNGLGDGGGEMDPPPEEPGGEGVTYWDASADTDWDQTNDMLTVALPNDSFVSWPWATDFDVTVSTVSNVTTVSGATVDVASYMAQAGARIIRVPSDGTVPALFIDLHVDEAIPVRNGNAIVEWIKLDLMFIRYESNAALVPAQYDPIRILGKPH